MNQVDESESPTIAGGNVEEDRSISTLYRMELLKGYFNSKEETQTTNIPTIPNSNQSSPSENSKDMEKSFNAWKSKNRVLKHPEGEECTLPMVSNLGRTLGKCQHAIPKTSPHCGSYSASNTNYQNAESIQNFCDNPFEQRKNYQPLILPSNSHFYVECDNDDRMSEYMLGKSSSSRMVNELLTPPPPHQKLDFSKQKLHYTPQIKGNYLREPISCSSFRQPIHYDPHLNLLSNSKSDGNCYIRDHCYCNQSSYHCCKTKGNHESCTYTGNVKRKSKKSENSSNKQISDLYKVVYLQNQQLELLQKQVQKLIEINIKQDSVSEGGASVLNKKHKEAKRTYNLAIIKENENIEKKVSVGIMTSFIENSFAKVSTDKELKINPKSENKKKYWVDTRTSSSSEDEVSAEGKSPKSRPGLERNVSFTLNDIVVPEERPPSPQASVHINMQEYKTSSESESDSGSCSSSSEEKSKPLGWTLYDTVVGKVNDMLKISAQEEKDMQEDDVRNATIDHLRQLGVSFVEPESPVTKRVTFNKRNATKITSRQQLQCDSETSLHMNALANKYLKQEHHLPGPVDNQVLKLSSPNNLSQATLRYLERYQLSPNENKSQLEEQQQEKISKKSKKKKKKILKGLEKVHSWQSKTGKILDITAIKKQPKLLPKNS